MKRKIPFPQANDIELIYKLIFDIGPDGLSKFDVIKKYKIHEREGSYYLDALLFIGVVEKIKINYFLTDKGTKIRLLPIDDTKKEFINAILDNDFLGNVYKKWKTIENDEERKKYIASCIYNGGYGLNSNTSYRRASSIDSWYKWINENK